MSVSQQDLTSKMERHRINRTRVGADVVIIQEAKKKKKKKTELTAASAN